MHPRFTGLVAVLIIPVTGRAEGESKFPTSLPPSLCSAKASVEEDQIQVSLTVAKMIPYKVVTMVPTTGPTLKTVFVPRVSLHYKACSPLSAWSSMAQT